MSHPLEPQPLMRTPLAGSAVEPAAPTALADPFDDPVLRRAFARAAGLREHAVGPPEVRLHGAFERQRLGRRQWVWAPYGLYAPVCADDAAAAALAGFLAQARRGAWSVQVQLNPLCPRQGAVADRARALGYQVTPRHTHVLDLRPGLEALRRGYHATKRNQLGKPLRVPSRIACTGEETDGVAALDAYFDVYADSLRRWGRAGGFPYPRSLFEDLLASGAARLWTHHVHGRLACAVWILESRHQALYWQGVSRIDEDQKAAHPMVRLMDAVIQDLCARGVPVLNLGASEGLPQVQRFKEEFGAQPLAYSALQWESTAWRWLQRARGLARGLVPRPG